MNVQSLLVIGGIILFSILALNVNRVLSNSAEQKLTAENLSTATTLAQGILYKVYSKEFDNATRYAETADTVNFSPSNLLGPETGETYNSFNDVDDYNNYVFTENTPRLGQFTAKVTVNYVNDNNINTPITGKSHSKLIRINIKNNILPDSLKFSIVKFY